MARYLMKKCTTSQKGKKLSGFTKYLANTEKTLSLRFRVNAIEDLARPEVQLEAFKRLAVGWITDTADRLRHEKKAHKPNAWNECMIDLVETARVHCQFFMAHCFIEAAAKAPADLQPILRKLSDLYVWHSLDSSIGTLVSSGYLTSKHVVLIRAYIRSLYKDIRQNAVALVDSLNIPDSVLLSPFGSADGDVYNKYFEMVKNAPGNGNKAPWWDTVVKPTLHRPAVTPES